MKMEIVNIKFSLNQIKIENSNKYKILIQKINRSNFK